MARGVGEMMARDGGWMVSIITSSAAHGEWLGKSKTTMG